MNRLFPKLCLLFATALIFSACNSPVEYDIPTARPELVVNSLFGQDSTWRIEISTTASAGQSVQIESLKDAEVVLTENGQQIADLKMDSAFATPQGQRTNDQVPETKLYFLHTVNSTARTGSNYAIRVSHPGYNTVYSESSVPVPTSVNYIDTRNTGTIILDDRELSPVRFQIKDPGGKKFYALEIEAKGRNADGPQKIDFYSRDKVFMENFFEGGAQLSDGAFFDTQDGIYFSNYRFEGVDRELNIFVDSRYVGPGFNLKIRLLTLSEEFYRFATSYQQQVRNADNPFASPTQVYSNVINGLGIFAGYAVQETIVR